MNTEEFEKSIHALHERLLQLTASKGEEYKRRDPNQFANFERGGLALGLTREQVLMVYLSKHLDSITTYVRDRAAGQEQQYAEPISGRIDDAILYLLLLRGMTIENDAQQGRRIAFAIFGPEGSLDGQDVEAEAAIRTLDGLGYTWHGGLLWKPPLGESPTFNESPTAPAYTLVVSSRWEDAAEICRQRGLPPGSCALSTTDQLHGARPGGHVVFVHHGSRSDEAMYADVRERCDKQGLTLEMLAL